MVAFPIVLSLLAVIAGALSLTIATQGVGLIGIACWLGIMARLAQAGQSRGG